LRSVLVSDTSVLIDLERGNLLEATFHLSWQFAVPDLLYKRELRDHNGPELVRLGLRVEALTEDGLRLALSYRARSAALSLPDTFAIALARIHGWILLTGDAELRRLAITDRIENHGVLWVLDRLLEERGASPDLLLHGLTAISSHPRCRLPRTEIRARLDHYARLLHNSR
jgi:AraC-like DNA-binding protein